MTGRKFDLNIEKILESWEPYHALREIIANAIDEQLLTQSKDIAIYKDNNGRWYVQDFGRGLKHTHLTQNENDEKLKNPNVIGKFGIGLKDALATLERHNIIVLAKSKFGDISLTKSQKQGFNDVITLHAHIKEPTEPDLVGTKFVLSGISDDQVAQAKRLFLRFSGEQVIEKTAHGEIVEKKGKVAAIYINGVKVSTEENFLFSYNITSLNAKIKKALNRERTNVGRSAYTDRVKSILLSSNSINVALSLTDDLQNYSIGNHHDELKWISVQEHAVKILNQKQKVVFVTPNEMIHKPDLIDDAKRSSYKIIAVPDNLKTRVQGTKDFEGNIVTDLSHFVTLYNDSFEFEFVDVDNLTNHERKVYQLTEQIFDLAGGRPKVVKAVKISETMRKEFDTSQETLGIWDNSTGLLVIKRSQLSSLAHYAGTLLHEAVHAKSGFGDVSRDFERELTRLIGLICAKAIGKPERSGLFKRFF